MKSKGIHHYRITPLYPKAENFIRRKQYDIEQKPWKNVLYYYLLNYLITTHATTKVSEERREIWI